MCGLGSFFAGFLSEMFGLSLVLIKNV